jgi:hypothetical protein
MFNLIGKEVRGWFYSGFALIFPKQKDLNGKR